MMSGTDQVPTTGFCSYVQTDNSTFLFTMMLANRGCRQKKCKDEHGFMFALMHCDIRQHFMLANQISASISHFLPSFLCCIFSAVTKAAQPTRPLCFVVMSNPGSPVWSIVSAIVSLNAPLFHLCFLFWISASTSKKALDWLWIFKLLNPF